MSSGTRLDLYTRLCGLCGETDFQETDNHEKRQIYWRLNEHPSPRCPRCGANSMAIEEWHTVFVRPCVEDRSDWFTKPRLGRPPKNRPA